VEAVVETTKEHLEERASLVQKVILAAAEPYSGEFYYMLWEQRLVKREPVGNSTAF
jgi:hypothetical protein